ncbi:tRNA pseudouridine(13) synthase TruD [Patescibacteria group bacterium]|nr:tRNA pseudouridine(13) synthase TruD [Patescibacteria group bacterium]
MQAFASYLFNRYLDLRVQMKQLDTLLPGDVVIPADGRAKHYT